MVDFAGPGPRGREFAGPGPNPDVHLARRQLAWQLWTTRNHTRRQIADALEAAGLGRVDERTIVAYIDQTYEQALPLLADEARRDRLMRATRLEVIIREALEAWFASKAGRKSARKKTVQEPLPDPANLEQQAREAYGRLGTTRQEDVLDAQETYGDPRYLKIAIEAMASRARLLGSDAPVKFLVEDEGRADETRAGRIARLRALGPEKLARVRDVMLETGLVSRGDDEG